MAIIKNIKKQLWEGKEGILIGGLSGIIGWFLLKKSEVDFMFSLVDEGLVDKVITTSQTTLADYKVLIAMVLIFATIGFYLDISGIARKFLRRNK